MKNKITIGLRLLLGFIFLVFGLNKFLNFMPGLEYEDGSVAGNFINALFNTPHFFILLAITEIIVGISLLTNLYAPLFLVILAPITLNIILFHLTLDPINGLPAFVVFILNWTLLYKNKQFYNPLLIAKGK